VPREASVDAYQQQLSWYFFWHFKISTYYSLKLLQITCFLRKCVNAPWNSDEVTNDYVP
jgi:hypothetical protein